MTTDNTTTTPIYKADQDLIDNAMLEMDKSEILKKFGALIKAELQKQEHELYLNKYRYRDLYNWELQDELDYIKENENTYIELKSRQFELVSYHDNRESNENWESWPVYAYIHGGMTVSLSPFSCSWDSGQLGRIWASDYETAKKQIEWLDRILNPHDLKFDVVKECYCDANGQEV